MDRAGNLANGHIGRAVGPVDAALTVLLTRAIADRPVFIDAVARRAEVAIRPTQPIAVRASVPVITKNVAGRTALMAQLSAKPWALDAALVAQELKSFANTQTFDALVKDLANGATQRGTLKTKAPVVIGWGRKDRLCLPRQAARAVTAFPNARLYWVEASGHFPMWDQPQETVRLILDTTGTSG